MNDTNNPDVSSPEEEAQFIELEKRLEAERAVAGTRKNVASTTEKTET